jgi:hypothetical protein
MPNKHNLARADILHSKRANLILLGTLPGNGKRWMRSVL